MHFAVRAASRLRLTTKSHLLAWPESTRVHDLTKGIPHPNDSVDVVYSSHMLEHLPPQQADSLLSEVYRVLKPGGTLRLVVPDLASAVRAYLDGDHAFFHVGDIPIGDAFMTTFYEPHAVRRRRLERLTRRVLRTEDGGHKWMYDAESLRHRLTSAGFIEIKQVARGEGREPSAAQLDHRSAHGLHFEAVKRRYAAGPATP